jgi:hypothetical protein
MSGSASNDSLMMAGGIGKLGENLINFFFLFADEWAPKSASLFKTASLFASVMLDWKGFAVA